MFELMAMKLLFNAMCCWSVMFWIGHERAERDAPSRETRPSQVVKGQGMTQQVSVTLNVSPQQISGAGLSDIMCTPFLWASRNSGMIKKGAPVIGLLATCISYAILRQLCLNCNLYLASPNSWRIWLENLADEHYFNRPQEEIIQELLGEINQRYGKQDFDDIWGPFIMFVQTISREIKQINRYLFWFGLLQRLHLTQWFPIECGTSEALERAKFSLEQLKRIFLTWVSNFMIASNREIGDDKKELLYETKS